MKKQLVTFTFAITLCSNLCGMIGDDKNIVLEFSNVVTEYVNKVDRLHQYISNNIQQNKDLLPSNMFKKLDHTYSQKNWSHSKGSITRLTYCYKGIKEDSYKEAISKENFNKVFSTICNVLKNKKSIHFTEKHEEHCERKLFNPLADDKDKKGVTFTFKVYIKPFNNSILKKNLAVIKDIHDSIESLEKLNNY